jgi:integrase
MIPSVRKSKFLFSINLCPGDIDFQARKLRADRALSGTDVKWTKTGESRSVDLSTSLMLRLREHLRWLKEQTLRLGKGEPQWVFQNREENPLEDRKIGQAFHRAPRKAKLPSFRVYELRHPCASQLLAAGVPLTYVSTQLGHAKPPQICDTAPDGYPEQMKASWICSILKLAPKPGTRR